MKHENENEWLNETYALLDKYKQKYSLKKIVKDTDLRYGWLNDFSRKRSENPGIKHVKTLYDYLKTQSLEV